MNLQTLSETHEDENLQYPKLFKNDGLSEVLSTHQLTNARVIGQADKKFIAFTIPIDVSSQQEAIGKSMIIVADQHAVDERILLERMLKSILDPKRQADQGRRLASDSCILLSPPRRLEVSSSEVKRALQYSSVFSRWGIEFFASPNSHLSKDTQGNAATSDSRHFQQLRSASKYFGQKAPSRTDDTLYIQVTKIPRVISDRCTTNTTLLKQIICDHIAWMESHPQSQQMDNFQPDDEAGAWSRYLRYCPRGIVDILKSKACRNAIMFNDSLTDPQCQKLIDLVSDCAFPFQCAHGRYTSQSITSCSLRILSNILNESNFYRLSMVPLMKYNRYGGDTVERSKQQPSRRRTVNWRRFRRPQH